MPEADWPRLALEWFVGAVFDYKYPTLGTDCQLSFSLTDSFRFLSGRVDSLVTARWVGCTGNGSRSVWQREASIQAW